MANNEPPFELAHTDKVKERVLAIAQRSREHGLAAFAKERLLTITERLVHDPEKLGDPLYAAKKPGGMIYRGLLSPFVVHYVVYAEEKLVLLWDIRVLDDRLAPP